MSDSPVASKRGLKAVLESKVVNPERLPMLEVVCDRLLRRFSASMRNLTSDAIDVSLDELTSARFGDFIDGLALSSMMGIFHVREWENYGAVALESPLIYAVVDALLGGRRGSGPMRVEGRGFTTIETTLVSKMVRLMISDLAAAFEPIAPVTIDLERVETNPRFVAIAGPSDLVAIATFDVAIEGRGGKFTILLPYATMEPVRDKLLQSFTGEKIGRSSIWQAHMRSELALTEVSIDVVLGSRSIRLDDARSLAVGQTITLDKGPDDPLEVHCGGVLLGRAHIGQRRNNIAVRMTTNISKGARG